MHIKYILDSIRGITHLENQDKTVVIENPTFSLFFVFDGVSSAKNASTAVNLSEKFIKENYRKYCKNDEVSLKNLIIGLNEHLIESNLEEMLTTCSCLYYSALENKLKFLNIGDTRIYGISNQYITKYTKDNNLEQMPNVLTKCLGMKNLISQDFEEKYIANTDKRILICSDGFYKFLEKNKTIFHKLLNFKRLGNVEKALKREIINNEDDSTYLLLSLYVQN